GPGRRRLGARERLRRSRRHGRRVPSAGTRAWRPDSPVDRIRTHRGRITPGAIDLPAGSVYFDWTNAPSREDAMFKRVVTSESELRALMGTPSERAIKKESATVDEPAREFIGHSPFLLLATSNAAGRCD